MGLKLLPFQDIWSPTGRAFFLRLEARILGPFFCSSLVQWLQPSLTKGEGRRDASSVFGEGLDPVKTTSPVNIGKVVFSIHNTVLSFRLQVQGIYKWQRSAEGWKRIGTNSDIIKDDGAGSQVWGQMKFGEVLHMKHWNASEFQKIGTCVVSDNSRQTIPLKWCGNINASWYSEMLAYVAWGASGRLKYCSYYWYIEAFWIAFH